MNSIPIVYIIGDIVLLCIVVVMVWLFIRDVLNG